MANDQVDIGLKSLGKRFKINRSFVFVLSALILILLVAFTIRILPIRWEIPSGQIHLNEYDPYYQYSITDYMVKNGLFSPYTGDGWTNYQQWYPKGLDMSRSLPALPMTAAALYQVTTFLGVNIDLMSFCSLLAVVLGTLSCLVIYFIGKDLGGRAVGLFAALFLALAPSFLQRTALGFFDTEVPGILGLLFFILMFLRSMDPKRSPRASLIYSVGAALALAYFITGWGAAYYALDLAALFVFVLVILKRYDRRLLINYGVTMSLALLIAIQFPQVGYQYLVSAPVLPVIGVFIVLLVAEFLRHDLSAKTKMYVTIAVPIAIIVSVIPLMYFGYLGSIADKFVATISPIARADTPLIASVAEHRIPSWGNLYVELGMAVIFFIVGLYFTLKKPTNRNVFLLIFGATGLYFGASMARLLAIFAPAFALIAAIGIIGMLKPFMSLLKETPNVALKTKRKLLHVNKGFSILGILLIFIILMTQFAFNPLQAAFNPQQKDVTPRAYSSGYMPTAISSAGLPLVPSEPLNQWMNMLSYTSTKLHTTDVVVAWWDYGYWLSVMGNVTTLADNATIDAEQIENLGFVYMSTEEQALAMLSTYGQDRVQYIAAFTALYVFPYDDSPTGSYVMTYGLGDEGKWVWMARISGGAKDRLTNDGFMTSGNTWTDEKDFGESTEYGQWQWNEQGMNTVIYKLLSAMEYDYVNKNSGLVSALDMAEVGLLYFEPVYISGTEAPFSPYGDLIPVVGLFKINWAAYNADHPKH
jgi:dolichyl-diphosphooligosaccharide--protein glycosyltransferase